MDKKISSIIESSDQGLVIGFHGCDQSVRDAIISGHTNLNSSVNDWDWLGDGIYFWQNNYQRALEYALNPPPGTKIEKPAVLGAVFTLGHCLDLLDKKWIDFTRELFENYESMYLERGLSLPQNNSPLKNKGNDQDKLLRYLDCAVIKYIHKSMKTDHIADRPPQPFESVRATFLEGKPIYENAGFYSKTHIQICIRNHNLIRGYFLPRRETLWDPWANIF